MVACIVAATSKLTEYEPHAPKRHFVCTLLRGTDTVETLKGVLEKAELVQDVHKPYGSTIFINENPCTVRVFLCGDHMLMYKIAGKDRHAYCNIAGSVPVAVL